MLRVSARANINPFMAKTERLKKMLKSAPQEYVRARVFAVYKFVIDATPQYSGALLDSWSLRTSNIVPAYTSISDDGDWKELDPVSTAAEFEANKKEAIKTAREQVAMLRYNTKIELVNTHYKALAFASGIDPDGEGYPGMSWRKLNHDNVRQAGEILTNSWNVRSVTIAKFSYLKGFDLLEAANASHLKNLGVLK